MPKRLSLNWQKIAEEYQSGKTIRNLATENNCGVATIYDGLNRRQPDIIRRREIEDIDIIEITHLYDNGWKISEIAKKLNVKRWVIRDRLKGR